MKEAHIDQLKRPLEAQRRINIARNNERCNIDILRQRIKNEMALAKRLSRTNY